MGEKVKFNQHPVISILLWILGTESNLHVTADTYNNTVKYHVDDTDHISHISGTLKWKDDEGGNINEYMYQTRPIVVSEEGHETTTQLKPESAKEESCRQLIKNDSEDKNSDIYDISRYSDSPQWGFYVSM